MKRKIAMILGIMISVTGLAGCAVDELPTLTETESKQIAEYASGLLLKYDAHNVTRLVDDSEIAAAYEKAYQKAELAYKAQQFKQAAKEEEENKKGNGSGEGTKESAVTYTLAQALSIDSDFSLDYTGTEIVKTYPSGQDALIVMDALPGNALYVVHFTLTNLTGEEKLCDLLNQNIAYSIRVNGEKSYKNEFTLLDDDLTIFMETVPAGTSVPLSVVFEMSESEIANMQSVVFKIKSKEITATVDLGETHYEPAADAMETPQENETLENEQPPAVPEGEVQDGAMTESETQNSMTAGESQETTAAQSKPAP